MQHNSKNIHVCLSLLQAGSMRFRWNEENTLRNEFFGNVLSSEKKIVPLELIHSKKVVAVHNADETIGVQADGIITCNTNLVPVLTVADCMPIFLYDPVTGCFGVLHSGWKGTGIVSEALQLAQKEYGSCAKDFCAIIGPHIKKCCYTVDEQRAKYFIDTFTSDCVELLDDSNGMYRLSLEKANTYLLESAGVKGENISIVGGCTCCTKNDANWQYGSFRRQTAHFAPNSPIKEMQKHFTPMAAFMYASENTLQSDKNLLVHTI